MDSGKSLSTRIFRDDSENLNERLELDSGATRSKSSFVMRRAVIHEIALYKKGRL